MEVPEIIPGGSRDYMVSRPCFMSNPTEVKDGQVRLDLSWGCDNFFD